MAHVLHGKIEIDVGIRSSAEKFHDMFSCRPHQISNMSPAKIQACKMHRGEWGKTVGSVVHWDYVHDGEAKVVKEIVEAIDDEKKFTTFRVIEGHLTKLYKNFVFIVSATSKGEGSVMHWTIEYKKLSEDVPEPFSRLEFCVHVCKDIDAYLISAT